MNTRIICLSLLMVTASLGWSDETPAGNDTGAGHRQPSPAGASVAIANIQDGAVVPTTFLVQFEVSGMGIAPAGSNIANTGHHHLLIDVTELPDPNLPLPKTDQILHFGGGQTETELSLPAGQHTLQLVFADYMHVPHDPVVKSDPVTITVSADPQLTSGETSDD